jgi:hypothetical protein
LCKDRSKHRVSGNIRSVAAQDGAAMREWKTFGPKWDLSWRSGCMNRYVREDSIAPTPERRGAVRTDRRKHSRSGRRAKDPRVNWRRLAWLFAGYALYLSARALPTTIKNKIVRRSDPNAS